MKYQPLFSILFFLALSGLSFAEPSTLWSLDTSKSELNYTSTKKNQIAEVHTVRFTEGDVTKKGQVKLTLDLASVNSAIQIRDERIKKFLFEIAMFPQASIQGQLNIPSIVALRPGESLDIKVDITLSLRGVSHSLPVQARVIILADKSLNVYNLNPIIVRAQDFKMNEGIAKLQELASLPSIATSVPVNFSLHFIE